MEAVIAALLALVLVALVVVGVVVWRGGRGKTSETMLAHQQAGQVQERLGQLSNMIQGLGDTLSTRYGQVSTQLENMGKETRVLSQTTGQLREALANTRVRGQWGERMADDVLRLVGFTEGVNYQKQLTSEGSGSRPDFTFMMPRDQMLNMDVKFPLDNYLKYLDASQESEKEQLLRAFLRDVRSRVREVTTKDYIDPSRNTMGCVLLFIPNEPLYHFIHENDLSLMDEALKSGVVLCSPMSLFAILVVIHQSMENFSIERASDQIVSELGTFNTHWQRFVTTMERMGSRLEAAQKEYDDLVGVRTRQLDRRIKRIEAIRNRRGVPLAEELDSGDGLDEDGS